jgi:hypothetical protein
MNLETILFFANEIMFDDEGDLEKNQERMKLLNQ